MTSAINLNAVAQFSAERMLNCMVEGVAIALFAWLLLRTMGLRHSGHQNSGTRFAVWLVALFAIASLPFVGAVMPVGGVGPTGVSTPAITLPGSWATYLFATWALIAAMGLLRVGVGLWHVRGVRKDCVEIEATSLDPALQATLKDFASLRRVKICVSNTLQVPTAIGFVKPVVALPTWAIRELSAVELNAILLHELAHLRRWDDWTNLAQKVLRAVFFFHPAVWWIENKLSLEREMACDDAVLAKTANPRAYAECLVAVAEKSFMRRGLAMAQAAVSRVRQTSQRVAQILDTNRPGATRIWKPALGMVAGFAVVCVGWLSHTPELVGFQDRATNVESASATELPALSVPAKWTAKALPGKSMPPQRSSHAVVHRANAVLAKTSLVPLEAQGDLLSPGEATLKLPAPQASAVPVSYSATNEAPLTNQQLRLKSVVVVYQGLEYDDAGFAHWTICVWRVNVPVQQQSITINPPKST
jgi:beta-lactamase regulating signal transducer with metallopeptidase domain